MARVKTSDDLPAPAGELDRLRLRSVERQIEFECVFGVRYCGEVCRRSFDGWRTINLCNSAKGEIFTRRPVR